MAPLQAALEAGLGGMPSFAVVAAVLGLAVFVATVLALAALVVVRLRYRFDESMREEIFGTWNPVFVALRRPVPVSRPVVRIDQRLVFLSFWVEQRTLATGSFAVSLDEIARENELDRTVARVLRRTIIGFAPSARQVSIALKAARWIDSKETRSLLLEVAESDIAPFAIEACESLLYLDDPGSVRLVITLLFRFPEHDKLITTRLGRSGGGPVLRALEPFLEHMGADRLEDFIYLIERSGDDSLLPILVRRLRQSGSDEEIASLLRAIGKFEDAQLRAEVLPFLNHARSFVRVQAAHALGRVGKPEDVTLLLPLLSDPEWWVRYRAAESLVALFPGDEDQLDAFASILDDPFAQQIIAHVRTEGAWFVS